MSVKSVQGKDPMKDVRCKPPKETRVVSTGLDDKSGASNARK